MFDINKKILFLDIDGVLNGRYHKLKTDYSKATTKDEMKLCRDLGEIDKEKLLMLNKVVEDCGFSVVLSSCWRYGETLEYMNKVLKLSGATFELIDFTPSLHITGGSHHIPRGLEIDEWIKANIQKTYIFGDNVRQYLIYNNYVILDDECHHMFIDQQPNIFQCDFETGLTASICYRITIKHSKLKGEIS